MVFETNTKYINESKEDEEIGIMVAFFDSDDNQNIAFIRFKMIKDQNNWNFSFYEVDFLIYYI